MIRLRYITLIDTLFELNLWVLLASLVLSVIIYYGSSIYNFQNLIKNFSNVNLIRFLLLGSLIVSFFIHCYIFWLYLLYITQRVNGNLYQSFADLSNWNSYYDVNFLVTNNYNFSLELFGLVFIMLAYLVGVISFLALDTRLYWKNIRFIFVCNFLVFIIVLFASVNDILVFFFIVRSFVNTFFFICILYKP